ncbi:MAG: class I SAM-dependent methyltransferase, partial [Povalibacter sp.]
MSRMPEDHIHRLAAHGFQAGAQTYVKGRPDYPSEVIAWLRDQLGLQNGRTVLDLGAGTGKFLPRLLATDAHVIAVEPVEAMRAALSGAFPQVEVRAGRAEAIPLESGSVDAVTCAQAFHWFATRPALAEIHRVLKSDGALGLIWNVRDESVEWVRALTGIIQPFEGDAPRYQSLEWRAVFPAEGFSELKEFSVAHAHVGPPE